VNGFRNLIANTTPRGRVIMGASVLGVIVFAFILMKVASAPSYSQIVSGMDPAETPKVTTALDKAGVKYEVRNNGTAIAVEKSQEGSAKIALASAGLPGKTQAGYELFDKQKLGASDFQQQVTYQRALEGEIAGTIEQIQGVESAQVNLVLADDQLFQDDTQPARASVLLQTGQDMDPNAARGIASIVTGAVKGMKSENVSVTDQTGAILWPRSGSDGSGATLTKQQASQRYDTALEAQLNSMLIQTLGPGKGQVQVNSDINADQVKSDELQYDKKGTPTASDTETETLAGQGGTGASGASGTAANIPSYAQSGSGSGNSNYKHTTTKTQQAVGKKITHTIVAPGAVNKQSVAIVLDKSVPPATANALKTSLSAAAGIDATRGDTISVSQIPFAKAPAAKKPAATANMIDMAKWVVLGLAMMIFLFFVTRALCRHEATQLEPVWLKEIETPTSLADLESGDTMLLEAPSNPIREQVEEIVEQHPERVAQQVRAWLNSGD
jgi:flagellar M-ring protein FliF